MRSAIRAMWLLCLLLATAVPAMASGSGSVLVRVTARSGGKPIADARVFLVAASDSLSRLGVTDQSGNIEFDDVPEGSYRLVVRCRGFEEATRSVEATAGSRTLVDARLSGTLKTIATVKAAPSEIAVFDERLSAASIPATLSKSLLDALDDLGGLTLARNPNGDVSGVSIDGKDPSLTATAFDGVQISSPLAMHALDPDLLEGVVVSQYHDSVDMLFLNPSLTRQSSNTLTLGGFNYADDKTTFQGTSGSVGYAAVAALRQSSSALDGATYLDTSGLAYEHHGGIGAHSFYGVLNAPLGENWNASLRGIGSSSTQLPIPTFFAGSLPYGTGPGNASTTATAENTLSLSGTLQNGMIAIALGHLRMFEEENDPGRVLAGQSLPLVQSAESTTDSLSLDYSAADKWSSDARFYAHFDRTSTALAPAYNEGPSLAEHAGVFTAKISRDAKIDARIPATIDLTAAGVTGGNSTLGFSIAPYWKRGNLTLRARAGSVAHDSQSMGGGSFDDPAAAQYDCAGGFVTVNAPSPNGSAVHAGVLDANADWRKGDTSFGVYAYDESYRGVTLTSALVPASSELGSLPPGYIASLQSGYATFGGCQGIPPGADRVFLVQDASGLGVHYRGFSLSWSARPALRVVLQGFVDHSLASLAADQRLLAPSSIYIPGSQLPSVAPWRFGTSLGWLLPDSKTELLVKGLLLSRNNPNNLPAYGLWSVGAERRVSRSCSIDVVGSNIGRSYVGLFTSPRYAVPIPVQGGGTLLQNAAPLPQPDIFVRLHFATGGL